MSAAPINYDALAQQHGATVDYDSLAAQHGATPAKSATPAAKQEEPEGFWHSLGAQFGITPEQGKQALYDHDITKHPLKMLMGPGGDVLESLYKQGKVSASEVKDAVTDAMSGNKTGALVHAVSAVPIIGPAMNKAAMQAPANASVSDVVTNPGAMGTLVGAAAQAAPMVDGAVRAVPGGSDALAAAARPVQAAADAVGRVPMAARSGVQAFKQRAYPQNVSIGPEAQNAQGLIRALVPDDAAVDNIKSAASVIPDVLAAAEKNGTVINGKLDMAKALRDRGQEVQNHFDKMLQQSAGDVNQVPANYNGDTAGGSNKATLTQISDRVDDINREIKSNFRKRVKDQTTEANASDADLIGEKQALTDILHNRLATLTGLAPEDIAGLRQNAGKMRSLAQEVELSATKDTKAAGRRDQSGSPMSIKNPVEAVTEKIGGGQEIIGNRIFKNALDQYSPQETALPQPQAPAAGTPTTPGAAAAEVTKANELQNAAQDAAAQRAKTATDARFANQQAQGSQKFVGQGYTRVLDHLDLDKSSGITRAQIADYSRSAAGKGQMIRASKLDPGSPQMRTLVNQIKNAISGQ